MKKLVNISRRRPEISRSTPNLSLPPVKKSFIIPVYES